VVRIARVVQIGLVAPNGVAGLTGRRVVTGSSGRTGLTVLIALGNNAEQIARAAPTGLIGPLGSSGIAASSGLHGSTARDGLTVLDGPRTGLIVRRARRCSGFPNRRSLRTSPSANSLRRHGSGCAD
jgi:hypothetical protein